MTFWLWLILAVFLLALTAGTIWFAQTQRKGSRYYYNKAIDCYQHEDWHMALDLLSKAYDLEPDYAPIAYNIGVVYLNLSQMNESKDFFEAALQLDENDISSLYNLGFIYYEQGDFPKALLNWQKAEFLADDHDAELCYCLALAYEANNDLELALAIYHKTISLDPEHFGAHLMLGGIYDKRDRPEEALQYLNKAIKLDPTNTEAYYEAALVLLKLGRWQESANYSQQVLKLDPGYVKAYNQLGLAYYCINEADKAIVYYEKALSMDETYATAYNNIAYAYEKIGMTEQAIESFKNYIKYEQNAEDVAQAKEQLVFLKDKLVLLHSEATKVMEETEPLSGAEDALFFPASHASQKQSTLLESSDETTEV